MFVKTNTRHMHIPKGSYHHHCRKRFQQFQVKLSETKRATKSVRTQRVTLSRNHNLNHFTNFEDYINLLQKSVNGVEEERFASTNRRKLTTADPTQRQRKKRQENQKEMEKEKLKAPNQIIDSHIPFFKCKLDNKQTITRRPDFKIKDSKFRVKLNVMESNFRRNHQFY